MEIKVGKKYQHRNNNDIIIEIKKIRIDVFGFEEIIYDYCENEEGKFNRVLPKNDFKIYYKPCKPSNNIRRVS